MKIRRFLGLSTLMAVSLAITLSGQVAAATTIKTHGLTGDHGFAHDDASAPGARCGYSAPNGSGVAHVIWVRVSAPLIAARDINAGRDQQPASWQVFIQRKIGAGKWKNAAQSPEQKMTTYDDGSATYTPMKVSVVGAANQLIRAVVMLRWYRNGAVEGWVKQRMDYYGVKWMVGSPEYVYSDACSGASD